MRNRDGVPVLKRGSRGKGAAFPISSSGITISSSVLRSIKQGQNVRLQVAALQILGLKQVGSCNMVLHKQCSACCLCECGLQHALVGLHISCMCLGTCSYDKQNGLHHAWLPLCQSHSDLQMLALACVVIPDGS